MRALIAAGLVVVALTGCGVSDEEVTAQVRAVEQPLVERLAASDQEIERLRKQVRAADVKLREAERKASGAEVRAKQAAEQALAPQKAEVERRATELETQAAALLEREKAVGTAEAQAAGNTIEGDGTYIVGDDVQPGTYKSAGGSPCYWARLGDGGADIIDNDLGNGPAVVTVRANDFALEVTRCAPFRKTS